MTYPEDSIIYVLKNLGHLLKLYAYYIGSVNFFVYWFWLVHSSGIMTPFYLLNLVRKEHYPDHRCRGLPTHFQDHCTCLQTHQERSQCKYKIKCKLSPVWSVDTVESCWDSTNNFTIAPVYFSFFLFLTTSDGVTVKM